MANEINKLIAQLDAQGDFLTGATLDSLKSYFQTGEERVKIAAYISEIKTEVIEDTAEALFLEESQLTEQGGNAYLARQYADCIHDLEYFLRYITYATVVGDVSVLEETCLQGLQEMYLVLSRPIHLVGLAITIMKLITVEHITQHYSSTVSDEAIIALAGYFDYLVNAIVAEVNNEQTKEALRALELYKVHKKAIAEATAWEPKNYKEWQDRDRLSEVLKQQGLLDEDFFDNSVKRFYKAWKQLPPEERQGVWREREIMAVLYERLAQEWKDIPAAQSVAVAERIIEGQPKLAGVLVFNTSVDETAYTKFHLPQTLIIPSEVPLKTEEQVVPLVLESMPGALLYSQEIQTNLTVKPEDILEKIYPTHLRALQSGDVLIGANKNSQLGSKVTLTTFVIKDSEDESIEDKIATSDVFLLSAGHGFSLGYTEVYSGEVSPPIKVGSITYNSIPQSKMAERLDVALIKPDELLPHDLNLKWTNTKPNGPTICRPRMMVQMYGGISGHQKGQIDYTNLLDLGPKVGTFPTFTVLIKAERGDSGALLVAGHDDNGTPFKPSELRVLSQAYSESYNFAMLGMLIGEIEEGSERVVFRAIDTVFQYLGVKAYLP